MGTLTGRRVVMVIAHDQFRDEEYARPRALLEEAGAAVAVACSKAAPAKGMLGLTVTPDLTIDKVDPNAYDAVIFVGGMGATEYWDSPVAHRIAKTMHGQGKVTSAICLAPMTLANAGLLAQKRATMWPSEAEQFKTKGVVYTGQPVERDGWLITGSGPEAAEAFGRAVRDALAAGSSKP
ncbi:MAG: DJ-1/PfpI family protein [Candidatus Omnitrophica bacterium]|nr:DJ-1/PfpI family protein [Candidatus Omnitrophota bacterium]